MKLTGRDKSALRDMGITFSIYIVMRIQSAERDEQRIKGRMERLRDTMQHLHGVTLGRDGGKSPYRDKMAEYSAKLSDLEKELSDRRSEHDAEMEALCDILDELPVAHAQVMHRRVIGGMTYAAIGAGLKYSESTVRKKMDEAKVMLKNIPDDRVAMAIPGKYTIHKKIDFTQTNEAFI